MKAPRPSSDSEAEAASTRVVVTGIGLVTGLGMGREATWLGIREGRGALRPPSADGCGGPELLLEAAGEAIDDARLRESRIDAERAATVIGLSKGDLGRLARLHDGMLRGPRDDAGLAGWMLAWPDGGALAAHAAAGFRGPCLAPVAACATGLVASLRAAALIRRGACDLALAGAGDASLDPLVLGAFRRMGVLAREPVMRPWDRNRSGFLVGAGAAVLVLERDDHARARGVVPYAELAGGACGADAYHMTDLNPDPAGLAHVIGRALAQAHVAPEAIGHVNVHGTATRAGDPLECRALRRALGRQADRLACSASKSQIGHLLGAAGAVELAITCLSVHHGFVPPTLHLTDADPACDLDGTPLVGRHREIEAALKLSIGFGGHLAVAVVRRWKDGR
jgi:3-oxoacyl-[acyl-carrier-protein] synthase II